MRAGQDVGGDRGSPDTIVFVPSGGSQPSTPPPKVGQAVRVDVEAPDAHVPLRLTVARGALGMELYESVDLGPIEVSALALTLPKLKFPVDLSGGVRRFRSRRGELEHLELRTRPERLEHFLESRADEVMGGLLSRPSVWVRPSGLGLGLVGGAGALAFDLLWAPIGSDARFVVANARGALPGGAALGYALRVVDAALGQSVIGKMAARHGRIIELRSVGAMVTRYLLPAVGGRAPSAFSVRFGPLEAERLEWVVALDTDFPPPELDAEAIRALELGQSVVAADEQLARGEVDDARRGYVEALEHAPKHPELCRLVAEIDLRAGGRTESALGMLVEAGPPTDAGLLGAELLGATADVDGAREAVARAASREVYGPVAAASWARLAELEPELAFKTQALDRAVAHAPSLTALRWQRFEARVARRDLDGALADAQHIEAATSGAAARHEVWRRAARALLDAGFVRDAGKTFERALRYMPDDPAAAAGLARSYMELGQDARAIALLERAIWLSERKGTSDADALIDLAVMLAERIRDLPQAVARLRQVPSGSARVAEARFLEGDYRAKLGDLAGASLAFARLREAVELGAPRDARMAEWLRRGARHELDAHDDVPAAERHLALALRLEPHDEATAGEYRAVAQRLAKRATQQD